MSAPQPHPRDVPAPTRPRRRRARTALIVAVGVIAVPLLSLVGFLVAVPPPVAGFAPETWAPGAAREFAADVTGVADARTVSEHSIHGPEDIVSDAEGRLYTGDRDGVIWRLPAGGGEPERWVDVGGRPLALVFAPDGRLLVANHGLGLQAVSADGTVETLVDDVDGSPILFANDLDVSADGIVYLSDSSSRYNTTTLGPESASYLLPDAIDGRGSGRVIRHELSTGRSSVVADGVYFPNGIALTEDGTTLWFAESNRYAVRAMDLTTGDISTVFADLPGTPDNIDRDADGRMLVAIYDRNAALDTLVLPNAVGREILIRLPSSMFVNEEEPLGGGVLVACADGTVLHYVTGLAPAATSVLAVGDRWYLGALLGQPVRWMDAP